MPPKISRWCVVAQGGVGERTGPSWRGVAAFLALAVAGLTSQDMQLVRAVYVVLEPLTRIVIVPLSLAAVVTRAGPVAGHQLAMAA